jgi:hypothetical protein
MQNPNAQWMRDAKWGFFTHFLPHMASLPESLMTAKQWNKKVNSLNVKQLGDQLSALKAPYFFITLGQHRETYCSPNRTFDKYFGADSGTRTERDLIAEIAAELVPRGIKMCVYINCHGYKTFSGEKSTDPKDEDMWIEVLTEWSERWGLSVSAWWLDGGKRASVPLYQAYINAMKAGNKDALVATKLWKGLSNEQMLEDFGEGESGFLLAVSDTHHNGYRKGYSENIPLHFLTFLGEFWGIGDPRFPVELVTGWTQHLNNMGGTVSWDCPITDSGEIPEKVYEQLEVLSRKVKPVAW